MTYSATEASRQQGLPVNLFLMRYGTSEQSYFAYTDAEQEVVDDGITYRPIAIQRGKINVSGTLDKAVMEIRAGKDTEVAKLFLHYPPPEVVNVTIKQGHLSDPDREFLVGWAGRITGSKRTDTEVVLMCEPVTTSMKRVGLRRHYQYSCAHVLYGPQCRANKGAATIKRAVESLTSNSVTLPVGWVDEAEAPKYLGGMLEWVNAAGNREYRTILRIGGGRVFTLSGPTTDLSIGSGVDVVKGCARTMTACRDHNNIHNFGGFPFIPKQNPIGSLNQFY